MIPYEDISFTIVVWNDATRLDKLLAHVRPWFKIIGVCVQESPDDTLEVAKKYADVLVTDQHRGYGDASYGPYLLTQMREKWTIRVDCDEWPTEQLLENLGRMVEECEKQGLRGAWVPFRSWVDDFEWEEDHSHLRLFQTAVPWPPSLHSRPMIEDTLRGLKVEDWGCLEHRRSLDEMVRGYLVYYEVGRGNKQWEDHNRSMMRAACQGAAERRGWDHVTSYDWWPDVVDAAYEGQSPIKQKEEAMPSGTVYAAGISSSGTRMLFDIIRKFGFTAQHASIPGYRFGEIPDAVKEPVWWDREWMESRYGEGRWIIMRRDPWYAAHSALRRGFVGQLSEYAEFADRANAVLETLPKDSLELQYEEFIKDPQKGVSTIAKWLEVPMTGFSTIADADEKYPAKPDDWASQLGWVPKPHAYKANRAPMDSDKQRCLDCGEPQNFIAHEPPLVVVGEHEFKSDRGGKCIVCGKTKRAKAHQGPPEA